MFPSQTSHHLSDIMLFPRAGVYHPTNTIAALPPVRTSGRVAGGRNPLERKATTRPVGKKTPNPGSVRKKAGEKKTKSETPRGSKLIQRYKNLSPRASFAPKNFQFTIQLQPQPSQPQPTQPREEEKEEAAAVRSPSPSAPAVTPARRKSRRISGVKVMFIY